jgi:hypothetical protein
MSPAHWNATVVDSPETEPFALVGDLVVAVRTPRSRDFVTVEVASTARSMADVQRPGGVLLSPRPSPCLADQWHGEVRLGDPVRFSVEGESYRLTLERLSAHAAGLPWVTCDFVLERE